MRWIPLCLGGLQNGAMATSLGSQSQGEKWGENFYKGWGDRTRVNGFKLRVFR